MCFDEIQNDISITQHHSKHNVWQTVTVNEPFGVASEVVTQYGHSVDRPTTMEMSLQFLRRRTVVNLRAKPVYSNNKQTRNKL